MKLQILDVKSEITRGKSGLRFLKLFVQVIKVFERWKSDLEIFKAPYFAGQSDVDQKSLGSLAALITLAAVPLLFSIF